MSITKITNNDSSYQNEDHHQHHKNKIPKHSTPLHHDPAVINFGPGGPSLEKAVRSC